MGLTERRAVQVIKDTEYKVFAENVKTICGFDIKMSFDWTLFENNHECLEICANKFYDRYMFQRLTDALSAVCVDDMGKEALQKNLKEIVLIPVAGDLEFKDGILTISNDLNGHGSWDPGQIQRKLEDAF